MSIKIAQLSQKRGDLNLSLYGRQDISKGLIDRGIIKDEKKLIETIKKAVKGVKGDKIRTNYAVCSLPEQEAFVRVVQLPILKKEELREAVKWEMEENIPLAIDEVYFDYSIVRPVRDKIDHFDILIGALPKKIVDDYVSVLEKSGIKIKALEIESIATSRALIKDGLSSRPVLIVDIGSQRTGFTIFAGHAPVLTSSSKISNNYLLETLAKNLDISAKEAKKLKFKFGLNDSEVKGKVTKSLKAPLNELVSSAKKYIDFYKTHSEHKHGSGKSVQEVILCGGGANLSGLDKFLYKKLGIPVKLCNPWANILKEPIKKTPLLSFSDSLGYATALGLALYGIK